MNAQSLTALLRTTKRQYRIATLLIAVLLTLAYALRKGQDVNWDQRNYHIAIPFLLLHGTLWSSVAPSGIQSYFNPLILIPQYLVIAHLPPLIATILIALAQLPVFLIAAAICLRIAGPDNPATGRGHVQALLAFILCLMSPIALSEAGTTYVDLVSAIPVLGAYDLLLRPDMSRPKCATLSGALLGIATGLKLTNAVFMFGAAGLYLTVNTRSLRRLSFIIIAGFAAVLGFLLVAGFWHWQLWQKFGNPIFPYFNSVFSADTAISPGRDPRFLPRSLSAIVTYPIYWVIGGSPNPGLLSPASEVDPRDARFAIVLLGTIAVIAAALARRPLKRLSRTNTGFLITWATGYLLWLFGFGVHRYMIPLEVLAGAVILCLTRFLPSPNHRTWALAASALVSFIVLHVPSWNRLPWARHWQTIAATPLQLNGAPLVFLTDKPTAFVAASLSPPARLVGLYDGFDLTAGAPTVLARHLHTELTAPRTQPYVVTDGPVPPGAAVILQSYGLAQTGECRPIPLPFLHSAICPLTPSGNITPKITPR